MNKKVCHLRCNTCKSQVTGETLGECLENIKCLSDGGPLDDTCKIALNADGKAVFVLEQKIKDSYEGKTDLSGKVQQKEKKPSKKKEESKDESQEDKPGEVPENTTPDVPADSEDTSENTEPVEE